jgi:hypothetical protein
MDERVMTVKRAIAEIEKQGILLVYPIDNRREPLSLWSCFYPRSAMRWEWDESGDDRVARLWHLREELSRSGKVVYAKWFRGRATFFSRGIFAALLALSGGPGARESLSREARGILSVLEMDSPLSTKQIKAATGLKGKAHERDYERAMKELWSRFLIVGFGEVDDGAFPSLAVGATQLLFEDLWAQALRHSRESAWQAVKSTLDASSPFLAQLLKQGRRLAEPQSSNSRQAPPRGRAISS